MIAGLLYRFINRAAAKAEQFIARMRRLKVLAAIVVFAAVASGCTNDEDASKALRVSGYTKISLTGYSFFTCSDSDSTCTGFSAIAPNGERVEGAVGCGYWGKGCTIRLK